MSPAAAKRNYLRAWRSIGKDAKTLARDRLAMGQADFSAAFRKSPMKRAKLARLMRNARVVLETVQTTNGVPVATDAPLLRDSSPH